MTPTNALHDLAMRLNRGENATIPSDVIVYLPENTPTYPCPPSHEWAILVMPDATERLVMRRKASRDA